VDDDIHEDEVSAGGRVMQECMPREQQDSDVVVPEKLENLGSLLIASSLTCKQENSPVQEHDIPLPCDQEEGVAQFGEF
jgi:hypothetical protein